MASAAARTAHASSRMWPAAVARISRTLAWSPSSTLVRARTFSNEGLSDPVQPVVGDAPPSVEVPASVPEPPVTDAIGSNRAGRPTYPPRNYRTPRGVYKAIILGEVGQLPIQKILKSGKSVTIFSVGTGGMYNNRRPFEGESPEEFADRSFTQWHRVTVYQDRLAALVMQRVKVGSQVYLEGNMESRVYNDPNSGMVKRVREIAVRSNGRLMFMERPAASRLPAVEGPVSAPLPDPIPSDPLASAQSLS